MIWRGKMKQDPRTHLWVKAQSDVLAAEETGHKFRRGFLRRRGFKKTLYGPSGRPVAQVNIHGSGNSEAEFDDGQDAVARPDSLQVNWSMAREHMPNLAADNDLPTMEQALSDAQAARRNLEGAPSDPGYQAEWRRAKNTMSAVKAKDRILRGSP